VIKHFPYRYRDYSHLAAQAAEAAKAQGQFWPMHDLMLQHKELDRDSLIGYAVSLNLNLKRFRDDLDSGRYLPRIEADAELARAKGLYQTPTFVINGRILVGNRPEEKFRALIDEALIEAAK
jgi:protein-disulfide isomerase